MSDITQRDAFFDKLYELARQDPDIVIVAADMSAPALDKFRRDLPSQFVNVGIAKQNATMRRIILSLVRIFPFRGALDGLIIFASL